MGDDLFIRLTGKSFRALLTKVLLELNTDALHVHIAFDTFEALRVAIQQFRQRLDELLRSGILKVRVRHCELSAATTTFSLRII